MFSRLGAGLVWALAVASLSALYASIGAARDTQHRATIVMAVRSKAAPEAVAADQAIADHLRRAGYVVTTTDDLTIASASDQADLILISSSVSGKELAGTFRHTKVPVITWEPAILPYMGMTGKKENVDYGSDGEERSLWLVNAPHPIAAGLSPGHHNVYAKNVVMGWGKPGLGASIIATLPGEPGQAAVFAYEQGAMMDYESIAPHRRAFLFLDNGTFQTLTPAGLRIFDAAVIWALGKSQPARSPTAQSGRPNG